MLFSCSFDEQFGVGGRAGRVMAALTPCMRLYGHLGTELAKTIGAGNPYQQWITTYSGPDFLALVVRVESLLDSMAGG
jgi:thiaminase/transcriptional activator TenA